MKKTIKFFICILILIITSSSFSQIDIEQKNIDWDVCKYYPTKESNKISIARSEFVKNRMENRLTPCSNFIIDFDAGFDANPAAKAAFQFAADIWSNQLDSPVPIRVDANFGPLDPGVLGGAGPNGLVGLTFDGGVTATFFARALAEQILGIETTDTNDPNDPNDDENPSNDIIATFSSTANFYFGTDENTPSNQIDFVTVVLHELGHGLGILGLGNVNDTDAMGDPQTPTLGFINPGGFPSVWDEFIENGSGTSILDFGDPSADLLREFTSNDLFSNGPITTFQNNGILPSIYAPDPFRSGSSYSHWDEDIYPPGNLNSLMTPFVSNGEAIHDPGTVTLGFMEDMGWTLCNFTLSSSEIVIEDIAISPNPFTERLTINLPSNLRNDNFNISITDLNGRVIINQDMSASNGEITLPNLNSLKASLYFITVESLDSGASFTDKIIKR
ncbi:T9SS type A sorting domain-containing protein [Winogradskyella immobilis]|uniref:T9SS type A sorting domain-containing protein n=1 Tax=Winogradskyella immobilis TaxID=2816852 RepID=A0ABS8ER15_9FLAO|nr:T9SS type A sorting domain-containing protein [Winogradskyella immobilis]MCC1485451.1 T9SS type A sorting domain-containing protein [Winogradskyella immobilis]MCG0017543.1 T9SS type A sorting domain-containing protein [Winogradskyella immobilis]